jgi:hypothetical protein
MRYRFLASGGILLALSIGHSVADSHLAASREQDLHPSTTPKTESPKVTVEALADYPSTYTTTVYLTRGARVKPILGTGPVDPGYAGCRGWVNRFEALSVAAFHKKERRQERNGTGFRELSRRRRPPRLSSASQFLACS